LLFLNTVLDAQARMPLAAVMKQSRGIYAPVGVFSFDLFRYKAISWQ